MNRCFQYSLLGWLLVLDGLQVSADTGACTCTGLDYTNGGSYLIDGSSNGQFTFNSEFECESIYPNPISSNIPDCD
jgi:hypothetical protein